MSDIAALIVSVVIAVSLIGSAWGFYLYGRYRP